ncbi:MAG: circularly permuted type 2 ATP-grasp protein [Egibacteraceae bacterium]
MISEAARYYNELIEADAVLAEESSRFLLERFHAVRLELRERILTPYLRPYFVTPSGWGRITSACEGIWSAIDKVSRVAPTDDLLMGQLGLTEDEHRLAAIDPGYEDVSVTSRLDSFLASDSYQFVELNAESPAGISYADVAAEIFLDLPVMRRFAERYTVTPMWCRQHMLNSLLDVYRRVRGSTGKPQIAIVDFRGGPTRRGLEYFKEFFEAKGYRTTIADPRDLEVKDGCLYHGAFRIDLVYRRVLTTELLEKIDECGALVEAYRSGAAVLVNSFRAKYVNKKMLFGVLTDERFQHYFDQREREAIRLHVPWTRRVEDASATYRGERIELLEFIRRNRDRLVMKPNDEYGGRGVFIGWEVNEREWDQAIEKAIAGDYLTQERVATGREVFPWANEREGRVEMVEQLLDVCPLLFSGRVQGGLTRLSSSSLTNVTSGAGMVPTMIVSE